MPGFFFTKKLKEVSVYEADTASEAEQKARNEINKSLSYHGLDPEYDDFAVSITDIKKVS